jgi:uncharacterized protein (TIGR02600 family)
MRTKLPKAAADLSKTIQTRQTRGMVLPLVLAILVLLVILVISFFAAATSESSSSQSYAAGSSARQLGESAVELVVSQLRLASTGAPTNTWTSQPGMLRTFGNDGQAREVFKLYSDDTMRIAASSFDENDDSPPSTWNAGAHWSAIYADINQPAYDAQANLVYPILDPQAATDNTETGRKAVAGLAIKNAPGYSGGTAGPANNPAPMPVRWLYVLKDGQFATPNSVDADGNVTFSPSGPLPSPSNPVAGRIAFWTDDETCKLNINTAGYGLNDPDYWTYWDTPIQMSLEEEIFLSRNQPWKGEYQRYPGHPATTGLNLILPELTKGQIFSLTPRLASGGSDGGSKGSGAGTAFLNKQDRLYASLDELFYNPSRSANLGPLGKLDLDAKRFFMTAHSRAPELNLFGQPRVTIWPIPEEAADRSALDKLIAFCGTIGNERFYFTRSDPMSPTTDYGLEGNATLYEYLQRMTSRAIPGFGGPSGGFLGKYGTDRNQILTGIFDTIRITNLAEMGTGWTSSSVAGSGASPYTSNSNPNQIMGQVVPTEHPNATRGAGRINIITEAAVIFTNMDSTVASGGTSFSGTDRSRVSMGMLFKFHQPAAGAVGGGLNFSYTIYGLDSLSVTASGTTQTIFTSGTYSHAMREYSFGAAYGGSNIRVNALSDTHVEATSGNNVTYDLPATSNLFTVTGSRFRFNGGTIVVKIRTPSTAPTGINDPYLQSYTFTFPPVSADLPTPGYFPNGDSMGVKPWNKLTADEQPASFFDSARKTFSVAGRFLGFNANWVGLRDVVRSMQLANGDLRSVAYLKDVPASLFTKAGGANYDLGVYQVHGLENAGMGLGDIGQSSHNAANTSGSLMAGLGDPLALYHRVAPILPIGINGVTNALGVEGDWDNGFAWLPDGAWLPKPDEGVFYTSNTGLAEQWGYFVKNNGIEKLMWLGNSPTLFSANRQLPSAVLFGSLPTGVLSGHPWQTLLFRPARDYHMGGKTHPGTENPPDHLLLDLFQMPVVEPYAISEPFSTAGKVNMNYRIKPFDSYITRDTGVRSVLESVKITAIPREAIQNPYYPDRTNNWDDSSRMYPKNTRWAIDSSETLKFFEQRFDSAKPVFVSESEICTVDLVPSGWTADPASLESFWNGSNLSDPLSKRFTGDNSRERPYALLYPRLTTRSNTYTVHVLAQALNPTASNRGGWNEKTGKIAGEWRGEYLVERYLDPADPNMPAFLDGDADLSNLYKIRTLSIKRFSP